MSATERLRELLDERGVEWCDSSDENVLHTTWNDMNCWFNEFPDGWTAWGMAKRGTPEQAIAATLGSELPYDELLRCLESDWHISASWDGLRKFWCIELTEEGVKLRNSAHSTLIAEQVRDVIEVAKAELLESCKYLGDYEQRTNDVLKAFGKMEQEIAATMGWVAVKR